MQAVREPVGDVVCKRSDKRRKPLVPLEQIDVDFIFHQILDVFALEQTVFESEIPEICKPALHQLVKMFPQHRTSKFLHTLDQSNCPNVVHAIFYGVDVLKNELNEKSQIITRLRTNWLDALKEGKNLHSQEQWTVAQNKLMTDAEFERIQRPFQICAQICGPKEMYRATRTEDWTCTRVPSLEENQLRDFVLAMWKAEGSGRELFAEVKQLTDAIVEQTAASQSLTLIVEITSFLETKGAYTIAQKSFILNNIVNEFSVKRKVAILRAFSALIDAPGEKLNVLRQHQHLLPIVKQALSRRSISIQPSATSTSRASTSSAATSRNSAQNDTNTAFVERVGTILYLAQAIVDFQEASINRQLGSKSVQTKPNKFSKLSPDNQCKMFNILVRQSDGRDGAMQILESLKQTNLSVKQFITMATEVYAVENGSEQQASSSVNVPLAQAIPTDELRGIILMLCVLNNKKWFTKIPVAEQMEFIHDAASLIHHDIRNVASEKALQNARKFWQRWDTVNKLIG